MSELENKRSPILFHFIFNTLIKLIYLSYYVIFREIRQGTGAIKSIILKGKPNGVMKEELTIKMEEFGSRFLKIMQIL